MTKNYKLFIFIVLITIVIYVVFLRVDFYELTRDRPIGLFGIIADVQYAEIDDLVIYGRRRYYRSGIQIIQHAVNEWKKLEKFHNLKFKFVLQLGDLLDIRSDKNDYDKNVIKLLAILNGLFPGNDLFNSDKILHLIGNHETAAFLNKQIQTKLTQQIMKTARILNKQNSTNNPKYYYYYDISDKLRLICLDLYEISTYNTSSNEFKRNYDKLISLNKNLTDKRSKLARYTMYNGAVSKNQLNWLKKILNKSQRQNKKIIMAGHIPLLTNVGDINIAWNAEKILDLIRSYNGLVKAYIAGHFHIGGYYKDEFGTHHLTVSSILEAGSNYEHRYVTGLVYKNKVLIKSQNVSRSFVIEL